MKEKYIPGEGCECSARCGCECGCDVDWTPREVYELREQRDRLAEELDALKQSILDLSHPNMKLLLEERKEAREQRDRLAEALESVKCELGVPQPEYPSPVANAYWIADEALQSLTPNEL
jgi:hypothetical protein